MEESEFRETLIRRLNILITLALGNSGDGGQVAMSTKIVRLSGLGLPPAEVADIIGKPTNYVTAVLNQAKKTRKKRGTHG